jgi:hypothetical protein
MAAQLSCSRCGGTVSIDEAALRRSLAVCSHCNAILRTREQRVPESDAYLQPPAHVVVERSGENDLSISARRPGGAWALTRATSMSGWAAGLAGAAACSASFGWLAAVAGLPIGLAAFAVAAKLQRRHRPIELRGGLLLPSDPDQHPVAVSDLQQIYSAVCHLDLGGDSAFTTSNVFALTLQGDRVLLMGPLESEPVALYIQQLLEAELQIYELPTHAESTPHESRERAAGAAHAAYSEGSTLPCEACGLAVRPSAREMQVGLASCSQCGGLSLLHDIDADMSVLGASTPERRYEIDEDVDGLSIVPRDSNPGAGSVEVIGERVVLRQAGSAPMTLPISGLTQIRVKEEPAEAAFDLDEGLAKLQDATSLSGTVDLRALDLGASVPTRFRVTAQRESHGEVDVAGGLQDPREAFLIARTLTRVLAKSG